MKTLYVVQDGYEVKHIPTLVEAKVLKEGPKTCRVESRWRRNGAMVMKDSVDTPYGAYSSTAEKAWSRYLKTLADSQQRASREMAEIGNKIRLAMATMQAQGVV